MDERFNELLRRVYGILKPMGYRKAKTDYRFYGADGLCRIINFQKNRWNTTGCLEFVINVGIYFEKESSISNRKFKEYECQIRRRFDKGLSEREEWWRIDDKTDLEALHTQIQDVLVKADQWFQTFQTKESTVHMILDGTAEQYSIACVMHYWTARLLVDMGYSYEVYEAIKDSKADKLVELANHIRGN